MTESTTTAPQARWLGRLFLALTLLQLIPIWSVRYLPTSDGATHLYNSWVLREILTGRAEGPIKEYYEINWRPNPNWLGHIFMAAAMGVVPPVVAEKLLVSATILIFCAGLWYFAGANDERSRAWALLGLPFVYNALLQMGFYNFAFSVGLYLLIVGVWWRDRDRPNAATIGAVAALLVVCYFAHPMSTLLAMGSIGLLWLVTLHGRVMRRHALHLIAFVPVLPLLFWFAKHSSTHVLPNPRSARWLWEFLSQASLLSLFDGQPRIGPALFAVTVLLFIATLLRENVIRSDRGRIWRFREADAFLLVLAACVALYVQAPAEAAGGSAVTERLALFIQLIPLVWFSGRFPPALGKVVVAVMAVVTVVNIVVLTNRYRHYDRVIQAFLRTTDSVEPQTTVLPLMFDRAAPGTWLNVLSHAIAYKAIEKKFVDLGNYEPGTWLFPIAFKPGIQHPDVGAIERAPGDTPMSLYAPMAQLIHTWKMPPDAPLAGRIFAHYRLVSSSGSGKVYRRLRETASLGDTEMVLLPLAGTRGPLGAPGGAQWQVDQQMTNTGTTSVRASMSSCAADTPCEVELAPGESVPLAANEIVRFITVRIPKGAAKQLRFRTVAQRVDQFRPDVHLEVPAIHESAFRKGHIEIRDVPFTSASRASLRLWITGPVRARQFKLRVVSAAERRDLAEKTFQIGPDGYWAIGNVWPEFPQLSGEFRANLIVEPQGEARDANVWALVTMIDNGTEAQRNILPASGTGF